MRENDEVNVYLNIKTDKKDNKYSGNIISIEDDLIKIKLDNTINFLNKKHQH